MRYWGAAGFGVVIGWVTYRTLRRSKGNVGLSDIATVIGAIGGAAVTGLFDEVDLFGWYSIGLVVGFFGYLLVAMALEGKRVAGWMGMQQEAPAAPDTWGRPST